MNVIGGLIFGAGFAILGYCPGTIAGAIGNGYLDALVGGLAGIITGAGIFAALYPRLNDGILKWGYYGKVTLPQVFKVSDRAVVIPVVVIIVLTLFLVEFAGL
ncbi:MAG TPA: YeeE/YedE thiosulfate transporter family protein [Synergistales bacterium]|nr:YeeE/YedE thiosulfate transporter family protein [Synergistales bacterium]